jgi:hypothetical protein
MEVKRAMTNVATVDGSPTAGLQSCEIGTRPVLGPADDISVSTSGGRACPGDTAVAAPGIASAA